MSGARRKAAASSGGGGGRCTRPRAASERRLEPNGRPAEAAACGSCWRGCVGHNGGVRLVDLVRTCGRVARSRRRRRSEMRRTLPGMKATLRQGLPGRSWGGRRLCPERSGVAVRSRAWLLTGASSEASAARGERAGGRGAAGAAFAASRRGAALAAVRGRCVRVPLAVRGTGQRRLLPAAANGRQVRAASLLFLGVPTGKWDFKSGCTRKISYRAGGCYCCYSGKEINARE